MTFGKPLIRWRHGPNSKLQKEEIERRKREEMEKWRKEEKEGRGEIPEDPQKGQTSS